MPNLKTAWRICAHSIVGSAGLAAFERLVSVGNGLSCRLFKRLSGQRRFQFFPLQQQIWDAVGCTCRHGGRNERAADHTLDAPHQCELPSRTRHFDSPHCPEEFTFRQRIPNLKRNLPTGAGDIMPLDNRTKKWLCRKSDLVFCRAWHNCPVQSRLRPCPFSPLFYSDFNGPVALLMIICALCKSCMASSWRDCRS